MLITEHYKLKIQKRTLKAKDSRFMPSDCQVFDLLSVRETTFQYIPGAEGTETIGSPAGGLLPEESFGGGAFKSAIGGLDGSEALGGGALPGL